MAEKASSPTISLRERSISLGSTAEPLPKWLLFSFALHLGLIIILFLAPMLPSRSRPEVPVYVVDLVGGEKIGGNKLGTEMTPPKAAAKTPAPEPAEKIPESKKESKPVEKKPAEEKKAAIKEKSKAEPVKPEPSLAKKEAAKETKKAEAKSETASADSVRERLLQSAIERARARAETPSKEAKGEAFSSGPGEGEGAAGLGPGGRGGPGVVKGMDFIIYQNRMLSTIKNNWVWLETRARLKVVVHFNIKDNGEVSGLKIIQPSGNPSFDESVLRAVRKSSPLPVPPEAVRRDFAEVELAFRPEDLGS